MADDRGYALLDAGNGHRLERLGGLIVDRPAPVASELRRSEFGLWRQSELRFDAKAGWVTTDEREAMPWAIEIDGLTLELRPTSSGGIGLFPEQLANLAWIADRVAERAVEGGGGPQVLNLFAHTGLVTLAAARAGAAVTHVDASRGVVAWARRNAELSGLADRPIRWIVDDAASFVAREGRRGRRYDGIVLDPPSFGRGSGGARSRGRRLMDDLPGLLAACRAVAAPDAFVLLSAHTTGLDGHDLREHLREAFGGGSGIESVPLQLIAGSGARLALGWAARRAG